MLGSEFEERRRALDLKPLQETLDILLSRVLDDCSFKAEFLLLFRVEDCEFVRSETVLLTAGSIFDVEKLVILVAGRTPGRLPEESILLDITEVDDSVLVVLLNLINLAALDLLDGLGELLVDPLHQVALGALAVIC